MPVMSDRGKKQESVLVVVEASVYKLVFRYIDIALSTLIPLVSGEN